MSRVAFIFRTDVHVADKSPISWRGDYQEEIWSSLRQIGVLAREHEATAVLDGGDYFHVKAASKNSHAIVAQSASIHARYPCRTWCIEGNHDIKHNNLDTLEEQPLGVLFESGVFQFLRDTVFEEDGLRVRVVGMPYSPFRTVAELQAIRKQPGDTHLVAVVHALAGENPPSHVEEFFGEPVFRYSDLIVDGGPDIWCFGHWHRDQGVTELQGRHFVNLGAVSRGALVNENLQRTPKVALLELLPEGVRVTPLPLTVQPAEEVFDLVKKQRQDQENRTISQFVERVRADLTLDPEASIEDSIGALHFARNVQDKARHYLELARGAKR